MTSRSQLSRRLKKVEQSMGLRGFRKHYREFMQSGATAPRQDVQAAIEDLVGVIEQMGSLERDFDRPRSTNRKDWDGILQKHQPHRSLTARWYPLFRHAQQHELWNCKRRFRVAPAGRRAGKSERGKRWIVKEALAYTAFPDGRFLCAAPTHDQAKEIFWDDLKKLVPKRFVRKISESKLAIILVNGARIQVVGLDKAQRVEGKPIDGILIDEFADCKPDVWDKNIRPALSTLGRPGWAWIFGVPRGARHYKRMFIDAVAGADEEWFGTTWYSADILPPWEIESARRKLDPLTFQAEYEASFDTGTPRVYYCFERGRNVKPLEYDPKLPLIFCFDFNVSPGVAQVCQEQTHVVDGERREITCFIDEVHIANNSTTVKVCEELAERWTHHQGTVYIYGDPAGGARGTAQVRGSDWDIIKEMMRDEFGDRVKMRVDRKAPAVKSRNAAMNSRLFTTDGRVHCWVDPKCQHLIVDLEDVIYDDKGEVDKKTDKKLTHHVEAASYYVEKAHSVHAWVVSSRGFSG